jgi:hypothetical protein
LKNRGLRRAPFRVSIPAYQSTKKDGDEGTNGVMNTRAAILLQVMVDVMDDDEDRTIHPLMARLEAWLLAQPEVTQNPRDTDNMVTLQRVL